MKSISTRGYETAFALPTVMIASVVMLIVLLSGLVAASSVSLSLRTQYYQRIASEAAESGRVFALACLKQNNYVPQWGSNTLKPNTNCSGVEQFPCPITSTDSRCGIVDNANVRATFVVTAASGNSIERNYSVSGTVTLLRTGRIVASTVDAQREQSLVFKNNPAASRIAKKYWIFGDRVGFDFGNSGTSMSTFTMSCASGPCRAGEGSTAITSSTGQLQFWTNGITIWRRNGAAMPNGSGLGANGSTTQGAVVFPIGSSETRYVVVSNSAESLATNAGELYSAVIDMTLNGGLGNVVSKNTEVWPGQTDYTSEALTAAPKSDGTGYWVLTFSPFNTYMRVFSFNNSGVVTGPPTTTSFAATVSQHSSQAGATGFGSLNFNSDYSKLVMMAGNHCLGTCSNVNGLLRVMSFNTATGQITNDFAWNSYSAEGNHGYSADFSPLGNYVYASTLYPGRLIRYNSNGTGEQLVGTTQTGSGNQTCVGGGQVLRAPDNRMYVANCGTNYVSYVTNPDAAAIGSIGWQLNGLTVGTTVWYGLPQTATIYSPVQIGY